MAAVKGQQAIKMLLLLLLPVLSLGSQEAILITGGKLYGAESQVNLRTSELLLSSCSAPSLPYASYSHTSFVTADGIILTCGGLLSSCLQLSPDLTSWTPHSSLPYLGTEAVHSALLSSGVYVVGRTEGAFLPTGASQWEHFQIPADHDGRQACTVPISSTSFLLIGGFWDNGDFVDEYEELTGQWTRWKSSLPEKREGAVCGRVGGQVLVTGGYNRATNDYDGATMILDIASRNWRKGGDMTWAREDHGVAVLQSGRVLAFGGSYGGDDTVEEWDGETETWEILEDKMEVERASFGYAVVNVIC